MDKQRRGETRDGVLKLSKHERENCVRGQREKPIHDGATKGRTDAVTKEKEELKRIK